MRNKYVRSILTFCFKKTPIDYSPLLEYCSQFKNSQMMKPLILIAEASVIMIYWLDIISFFWMDIIGAVIVVLLSLAYYSRKG